MNKTCGNLLLVDDDRQTRLKLTRALEAEGHTVTAVEGGEDALKTLEGRSFDLILLDILMPRVDGFAVLEALHAEPRLSDIPVVIISALDDGESEQKCRQLGAQAFLNKPVDAALLNAKVVECLGHTDSTPTT